VVCPMGAKWLFSLDHIFHTLFRTTTESEMHAGSTSDTERATS
jgi:hypothetical protein